MTESKDTYLRSSLRFAVSCLLGLGLEASSREPAELCVVSRADLHSPRLFALGTTAKISCSLDRFVLSPISGRADGLFEIVCEKLLTQKPYIVPKLYRCGEVSGVI